MRGFLGFLVGVLAGGAVAVALCVAAGWLFDISQAEGAYAMAVAFFYAPVGAIIGGVIGAVVAVRAFPRT